MIYAKQNLEIYFQFFHQEWQMIYEKSRYI